ncbi:MAG: hydroxylamine reductase [Anaerolineae bacterium]|nr:hydroxylamine reductase [Anaerolineae bacterium]
MKMFCYQCQETAKGTGCTIRGVCGKPDDVAVLQDLLIYLLKGISLYGVWARELGVSDPEVDLFVAEALFATITNVNFDAERFREFIAQALALRERLKARFLQAYEAKYGQPFAEELPEMASWVPRTMELDELIAKGRTAGIMSDPTLDEDIRSLREMLTYGLKGMAAYLSHAAVLGYTRSELFAFLQEGLASTTRREATADEMVGMVLRCGEMGIQAMALLDEANTSTYGNPEPSQVDIGVREGPAILVSGHDLRDLEELLQQTEGKGINVYTHGEMLPANAYPGLKKYPHLVGNYGGAWWRQPAEFERFGGAILMTTNCLVPPRQSYIDRLFTTGVVGWPDVPHIPDRKDGQPKDFGPVIAKALELGRGPEELEKGKLTIGFAHAAVLSVADKVIEAIQRGDIKRFVVMAGCDGRHKSRQYFTDIALGLPPDSIILTAGCAKYRYNKLDLGTIGGIPRVLDAGQCNDSYSLIVVAQKLAEALGIEDLNDLPIEYDIAWYEQKAVLVLLALLSLGIKRIRLGPTLPAFISPNVRKVLMEKFDLRPTTTVEEDLSSIIAGT